MTTIPSAVGEAILDHERWARAEIDGPALDASRNAIRAAIAAAISDADAAGYERCLADFGIDIERVKRGEREIAEGKGVPLAQVEREIMAKNPAVAALVKTAVAEEREACAVFVETRCVSTGDSIGPLFGVGWNEAVKFVAKQIRARGKPEDAHVHP